MAGRCATRPTDPAAPLPGGSPRPGTPDTGTWTSPRLGSTKRPSSTCVRCMITSHKTCQRNVPPGTCLRQSPLLTGSRGAAYPTHGRAPTSRVSRCPRASRADPLKIEALAPVVRRVPSGSSGSSPGSTCSISCSRREAARDDRQGPLREWLALFAPLLRRLVPMSIHHHKAALNRIFAQGGSSVPAHRRRRGRDGARHAWQPKRPRGIPGLAE